MPKVILLFLSIMYSIQGFPQEVIQVSLDELKRELVENNLDIRLSSNKIAMRKEEYRMSASHMLPSVNFSSVLSSTNVPLHAFGTRLQQSRIAQEDFNPSLLNDPGRIQNFQAALNVVQPLVNLDTKNYKKASNLAVNASESAHEREQQYRLFELEQAYLQLQQLYNIGDELSNIYERVQRMVAIANDAVEVGYAYEDDVMKARVRLKEIEDKVLETSLQIQMVSNHINYFCGKDINVVIKPIESLDTSLYEQELQSIDPTRADFEALRFGIEANKEMTLAKKNSSKPRLNAILSYEANIYDFVDGGHGYWAGLQLSWQLFDGKRSSVEVQKSMINQMESALMFEKSQKESTLQLSQLTNQNRLIEAKIATTKEAILQASETFRISTNRFREGIEKATDLIRKEIELSQRSIDLIALYYQYQLNLKTIKFTVG